MVSKGGNKKARMNNLHMKVFAIALLILLATASAQSFLKEIKGNIGDVAVIKIAFPNETTGELERGIEAEALVDGVYIPLYDDGSHLDDDENDGVYANNVTFTTPGTRIVYITGKKNGIVFQTYAQPVEISEKPIIEEGLLPFVTAGVFMVFILGFFIYKKIQKAGQIDARIKELEDRKQSVSKALEDAQRDFFTRKIDEQELTKITYNYKQELASVELELNELLEKKAKKAKRAKKETKKS